MGEVQRASVHHKETRSQRSAIQRDATAAICRYCHRRVIFILSLGPQLVVHGVAVERFSPQQHIRLQEEFSLDTISHLIE